MLPRFAWVRPRTLADAVKELGRDGSRLHAGGTDLLGCLHDGVFGAERVVSLSALDELRGIGATETGDLRIGARATLAEIADSELVRSRVRLVAEAAQAAASPQLRNQGTLGGNLNQRPRCWYFRGEFNCLKKGGETCYAFDGENRYHAILGGGPCWIVHPSDTAPALIAVDAVARVAGPSGLRAVPLESFFVLPETDVERETVLDADEIVTEVIVPASSAEHRSTYRKVRERASWDFALASVAAVLRMDGERVREARIVLGGVAPTPWRAPQVEAVLRGARLTPELARKAGAAAARGAEPLRQNAYKVALLTGTVEDALLGLARS